MGGHKKKIPYVTVRFINISSHMKYNASSSTTLQ